MKAMLTDHRVLRIDAPEWFALDAFRAAVERGTAPESDYRIASFHRDGMPLTDTSDIFILFDARQEVTADGTNRWIVEATDLLDEPGLEEVYESVAEITRNLGMRTGLLWLTNVGSISS